MSAGALLLSLLMIVLNALFVAFEFSIVAAKRRDIADLAKQGSRAANRVLGQMEKIDGYLAACQFGITLTSLALTAVYEPAVRAAVAPWLGAYVSPQVAVSLSALLAVGTATVVQVILGELFPKAVAITMPVPVVLSISGPMRWVYALSAPLNATYNRTANWLVKALTGKSVQEASEAEPLDTGMLLQIAYEQGRIDGDQKQLMQAALAFPTRTAREVMTPADRVVAFQLGESEQMVYRTMRKERHTRYPVFDGDELKGYVLMHDIFRQRLEGKFDLGAIVREIVAVPETVRLDRLRTQYREHPIMAVYDERNEFVGIITAEDLTEEIVGDVRSEGEEPERPVVQHLPNGAVLIDATALVDEVAQGIGVEFDPPDGVDTFGGLLLSRLGREPKPGDVVRYNGWVFVVRESEGFSIRLVEGKRDPREAAPERAGRRKAG